MAKRVKKIRKLTSASCCQHCGSKDNPADLITRGLLADKLMNNYLWLYGPGTQFPCQNKEVHTVVTDLEKRSIESTVRMSQCTKSASNTPLSDFNKYSELDKLLRVTAYI